MHKNGGKRIQRSLTFLRMLDFKFRFKNDRICSGLRILHAPKLRSLGKRHQNVNNYIKYVQNHA